MSSAVPVAQFVKKRLSQGLGPINVSRNSSDLFCISILVYLFTRNFVPYSICAEDGAVRCTSRVLVSRSDVGKKCCVIEE